MGNSEFRRGGGPLHRIVRRQLSHSYDEIISLENICLAWEEFIVGKKQKRDVREFSRTIMDNIVSLHESPVNRTFRHGTYQSFYITDPKLRHIHKASVRDRLLHHAVYRILYPFFDRTFIADSFSCRNWKGMHKAIDRLRQFAAQTSRNHTRTVWILKCDIKKFFASIDHRTLLVILREYIRYADDFVFLSDDRAWLMSALPQIREVLQIRLHLLSVFAVVSRSARAWECYASSRSVAGGVLDERRNTLANRRLFVLMWLHMIIELLQKDILSVPCDLLVVNLFQGVTRPGGATGVVDKALDGAISSLIQQDEFEGKLGQSFVFPTFGKLKARKVAIIGLGDKTVFDADTVRKVGGYSIKLAEQAKARRMLTILHGVGIGGLDAQTCAAALVEGLRLSAYRFHTYHGTEHKKEKKPHEIVAVQICETVPRVVKAAQQGIKTAEVLARATCYARDLVNTPSSHMTPKHLAEAAQQLAGRGISVKIMDKKELERRKMQAALAVGRGSEHAPVGIHLIYRPRGTKKTVAIVGKAVTFDSGGLSLKPADSMMTMKLDMAGAATVLGLFQALVELKPAITVHGIFLAVENMPSGSAYRPGDIVTAMNGTTIEVLNTDAEGRVTLADALSYAVGLKPDMLIDIATLTGACVVALGEDVAGLFSNSPKLAQKLLFAAHEVGEALWELPLYAPYTELIKSKLADLKNIGGGKVGGGAITAALFLRSFVGAIPWAHLDIAGPSYIERETRPDQPYGASGYGVRLLARFLAGLK